MNQVFIGNNDTQDHVTGTRRSANCLCPNLYPDLSTIHIEDLELTPELITYDQQGFVDNLVTASVNRRMLELGLTSSVGSLIENSLAFLIAIKDAANTRQFFSILFLYFKTLSNKSVAALASEYAATIFSVPMTAQSGVYGTDLEYPEWLKALKELSNNWTLAIGSELFIKVGRLLGMFVAVGLCAELNIAPTIGGLDLFTMPEIPKKVSAISLIDAVFDLVVYFCEGGYVCFMTGSISPLFYGNIDTQRLCDMYQKCKRCSILNLSGQLKVENSDEREYTKLLADTKDLCKRLKQGVRGASEKLIFQHYLDKLDTWEAELLETRMGGGSRIRPICIYLYGGSKMGKSTCVPAIMTTILKSNGFPCEARNISSMADQDKYMSTITGQTTGIVLDDVNNIKPEYQADSAINKIVIINNNNKTYAIRAGVEEKGKIPLEPMCCIATSNTKDGGAHAFSNEPLSWVRRYDIIITFKLRPEYSINGMLDTKKANEHFPDALYPDIYLLKMEEGVAQEIPKEGDPAIVAYRPIVYKGKTMIDVSYPDAMRCLIDASRSHYDEQRLVVERSLNLPTKITLCEGCGYTTELCLCQPCSISEISSDAPPPPPYDSVFPPPPMTPPHIAAPEPTPPDELHICSPFNTPSVASSEEPIPPTPRPAVTLPDYVNVLSDFSVAFGDGVDIDADSIDSETPSQKAYAIEVYEQWDRERYCSQSGLEQVSMDARHSDLSAQSGLLDDAKKAIDAHYDKISKPERFSWFKRQFSTFSRVIGLAPATAGAAISGGFNRLVKKSHRKYFPAFFGSICRLEEATTETILERIDQLSESPYTQITNWIPEWAMDTSFVKDVLIRSNYAAIRSRVLYRYGLSFAMAIAPIYPLFKYIQWRRAPNVSSQAISLLFRGTNGTLVAAAALLIYAALPMEVYATAVSIEQKALLAEIVEKRKDLTNPLLKRIRDSHLHWIMGASVTIAGLYGAIRTYRAFYPLEAQGSLAPSSKVDIESRDAEKNPWVPVASIPIDKDTPSYSTSFADLCRMVENNTTYMEILTPSKRMHCNAVFLKSNVALVPKHIWETSEFEAKFTRRSGGTVGSTFKAKLSSAYTYAFPDTDLSLVWIPSGGTWKDLTAYLTPALKGQIPAQLMYRSSLGNVITSKARVVSQTVKTSAGLFPGGTYTLEWPTFRGLCMAPVVSETRAPLILGFHLGGTNGKPEGACGTLSKAEFDLAFSCLQQLPGVLLTKSHTPPDTAQFGVQFFTSDVVSDKSAVRYLTGEPVIQVYGQVTGRATMKSEVITSPISAEVTMACGVIQQWGPPMLREDFPFQRTLIHSAQPAIGFEGVLLIKAVKCLESRLVKIYAMAHLREATPLSKQETISGIDGLRFIDPMKKNSAIGFPLTGPKSRYMRELPPTDQHQSPFELEERFWSMYDYVVSEFRAGRRVCLIFKACLKDTPTKLGSDKVRKFDAGHPVLQLGMRKYFLPVARHCSLFPLESECAVGINAESPEWEEMHMHIVKHGKKRIMAGDHSKYDARMPAQLICAAFRILIEMARKCNYTEDDICVMEGFATEVVYAYSAFNGELIQFIGSNPSGHSLTVYINSIVNSLMLRCAFYHIYPKRHFSTNVSLMTYGDDCIASVSRRCTNFNNVSIAAFLADNDFKFTMPDKHSEPVPFLDMDDADFLKRKSFFHPDLNCWIGKLDDASIFKSLHCQMLSKHVTSKEIAAQNIDGALAAWFYHGKEVFSQRLAEMTQVAHNAGIAHMTLTLDLSYESRVEDWLQKYRPYLIDPIPVAHEDL